MIQALLRVDVGEVEAEAEEAEEETARQTEGAEDEAEERGEALLRALKQKLRTLKSMKKRWTISKASIGSAL